MHREQLFAVSREDLIHVSNKYVPRGLVVRTAPRPAVAPPAPAVGNSADLSPPAFQVPRPREEHTRPGSAWTGERRHRQGPVVDSEIARNSDSAQELS